MIGAGAVVTKSVKPHAIVVKNPAKQVGWVSHAGEKLDKKLTCPLEGRQYSVDKKGNLKEIKKYGDTIKKQPESSKKKIPFIDLKSQQDKNSIANRSSNQ